MRAIKEILRLHFELGLANRAIGRSCNISPTTAGEYIERAEESGIDYKSLESMDDAIIYAKLFPEKEKEKSGKEIPDFAYISGELKKKGVTLQLLYEEYQEKHPNGYKRTQFYELCEQYTRTLDPVMRMVHKGGEKLFVDFSGDKPHHVDRETGEIISAELFVAVMGASNLTYALALPDQKLSSWLKGHIKVFEYIGGVVNCLVPDNLKAGVKSPCRYDPELNPIYAEMAAHYGTAVVPARPYSARDKAKVENGVLNAQRRILASLRNRIFFSLYELNDAIAEELEKLNNRPMQGLGKSRWEVFNEVDKAALKPLPEKRFEIRDWKKPRVNIDYHIEVDHNYYSVPYRLIRQEVEVFFTATTVEIYSQGKRVASHVRCYKKGEYLTIEEHRPYEHKKYLEWSPDRVKRWAGKIGDQTAEVVEKIMASKRHPEHGFRACLGVIRLAKKFTPERLELACKKALETGALRYKSIKSILENHLESREDASSEEEGRTLPVHENIRGGQYYGREEQR